jgi:phage head maturation protease
MTLDRCYYPSGLQLRDDGDGRTLVGPLLPWGITARVVDRGRLVEETFERGALHGTDPARVPLTATHPRDAGTLPIGVTVELEERDDAAWGAWRVSKTALGDEVLALAADGVPLGLSVGFAEVPGGSRWSVDRRRVTRTRPRSTTWPSSGCPPTPAPAWPPCAPPCSRHRPCSPWPGSVGKGRWVYTSPVFARRGPARCLGQCGRRLVYGDRCPDCARELRQRKRRKPR